jgi:hypothetical protein
MNRILLIISILESIYLIYTFHFLKTSIDFNLIKQSTYTKNNKFFYHISGSDYGLRICLFGRIVILALIAILLLRNFYKIPKYIFNIVLLTSVIFSGLNYNATVFLLPVWITEFVLQYKKYL